MITGAHSIIYSKDAEADRKFLQDVLKFPYVDVGYGWLIFGLPPSEVAVHPGDENDQHEFYLMCDDVSDLIQSLGEKGVACTPVHEESWGSLTQVSLPGGGKLGIYQPKHARPPAPKAQGKPAKKAQKKSKKKAPKKKAAKKPAKRRGKR
jgi:hypothetical protein